MTAIGPLLDALAVTAELEDDEQIVDVLVIAKLNNFATGTTAIGLYCNGLDWVQQAGLIYAADQVMRADQPEQLG